MPLPPRVLRMSLPQRRTPCVLRAKLSDPRRVAPRYHKRAAMPEMAKGGRVNARECHDRRGRRDRRPDHGRGVHPPQRRDRRRMIGARNAQCRGAARPPKKGPAPGGRLNRRDRPLLKGRGRWPQFEWSSHAFCLRCQRTAPLFHLIRRSQGPSRFSAARISVSSLLLEWAAISRKASPDECGDFLSIVA